MCSIDSLCIDGRGEKAKQTGTHREGNKRTLSCMQKKVHREGNEGSSN